MSPKFSIVIPVYNVAPYLRECLDSVLAQTFTDWEAICVDDGSTDGSGAILDEYAKNDERFRVVHQGNGGVSAARNVALDAAQGEYLIYLDADDLITSEYLADIAEAVGKHGSPDLIRLAGFIRMKNNGERCFYPIRKIGCATPLAFICDALITDASLWLNVFRREAVSDIRFPMGVRYGEDDVYVMRQMGCVKSVFASDVQGYVYRFLRVGAASRTLTCADMAVLFDHLRENIQKFLSLGCDRQILLSFYRAYLHKNMRRVTLRDARIGSETMRQSIMKCREELGQFESVWKGSDRLWLSVYMNCGSFIVSDFLILIRRFLSKIKRCRFRKE